MSSDNKRPQFLPGEPVTSSGFRMEQTFHIRQRELWNKALSGWGIIGDGFQLEYVADLKIARVSIGTAIGQGGHALMSDRSLESPVFNPEDNSRFALVYIQRISEGCDETISIDREGPVFTSWQDRTVLKLEPLSSEAIAPDKVKELTRQGCIVVGSLEKLDGTWKSSDKFRQQGPIDPPGSKDAARIANAISVNGFGHRESVRRTRNLLFWLGTVATSAMTLVALMWICVWYCNYFVPPQVPYSVAIEEGKDLQGPIAGETYDQGEFTVVVKDQFGKPIKGIEVEYKLGDRKTAVGNTVPPPTIALFVDGISNANVPDIYRVKTDSNGKASPGKIRFAGLPLAVTSEQSVKLAITFPEADLASIERTLVPVSKKCDRLEFIGNFLHTLSQDAQPKVTAIPEVHRLGDKFYLRLQALNGGKPVSMSGLKPTCKIWSRRMTENESFDKIDELLAKGLELPPESLITRDELKPTTKDYGSNSWITFELKPTERGVYKAEVILDGVASSPVLFFLVK